jgi:aminodeoxyfutalosine synthase
MLDTLFSKIGVGERLTEAETKALAEANDIIGLGMLAEEVRRRRHGDRVTFLRVAHVTLASVADAQSIPGSAGEVRLRDSPASIEAAAAGVRAAIAQAGDIPISAFSLGELDDLAHRIGVPLAKCLAELKSAGLEQITELAVDHPGFESRLETVVAAGMGVSRLVFDQGGGEWLARIRQVAVLCERMPAVRVLAPLPRQLNPAVPTTGYQDLKRVALARVVANNVETIQVDWSLYGPKLAQVALTFGANDLDDVPAADDLSRGARRATVEEVRRNIRAAALVPVERNARWEGVRS